MNFNNSNNNLFICINKNIETKVDYNGIINNLKKEYNNKDIVGILKINNSNFEIPIVQGEDNDYYLNHALNNEASDMGAIFLDYRTDINLSKKLLIYGHSSSKTDIPFNILEEYYDKDYYNNHKYIQIITSEIEKTFEIFSVYIETLDFSYMNINFINNEDFLKHIESLKNKSMYDIGIDLKEEDEVLILQTCSNHIDYSNYSKKYLLIISRRIK